MWSFPLLIACINLCEKIYKWNDENVGYRRKQRKKYITVCLVLHAWLVAGKLLRKILLQSKLAEKCQLEEVGMEEKVRRGMLR